MSLRVVRAALTGIFAVGCALTASGAWAQPEKPTPRPPGDKRPPTNPCNGKDAKECEPKEARIQADAWFPLGPGTTWTWRSTVKQGDQAAKQTEEKRTITKVNPVDKYFEVVFDKGGSLYVNADGVFDKQCGRGGKCHYASRYPRPAKGQTNFRTTYGGDVSINVGIRPQAKPVVTPAGSFKNCIEYHFFVSEAGKKIMFCPGVGEVAEYFGDVNYDGITNPKVDKRLELLRFKKGK